MKFLGFIFFYIFSMLVGLLPFPLIYLLSDFSSFILRKLVKYRRGVIENNLTGSFPGINKEEFERISRRFYLNLADITLEGIKAFTMSGRQLNARYRVLNPEIVNPYLEAGRSVICVTGHYGNWEWGALSPPIQIPWDFVGFYKPLKYSRLDRFVRNNRSRFGTNLSSIRDTTTTFEANRGKVVIYLMAADQSPSNRERAYWINFMNRDTAFLHGPERHARINNHLVVFAAIRRVKRGFYELNLSIITDDPSSLADGEITRQYANKMESLIREDPANWLWSHKRWKLIR